MKISREAMRKRAAELAERCGCRTWQAHKGVAIWQLEEALKKESEAP